MFARKTSMLLTGIVVKEEDLKPGDHVFTFRLSRLYSHHGIYTGDGYVIHMTRKGVDKTSLHNFRREGNKLYSLYLYAYKRPHARSSQEVITEAHKLLANGFGKYNLIHNNCEHFATFCRTGTRASAQTAWISRCGGKIKEVKEWVMKFLRKN